MKIAINKRVHEVWENENKRLEIYWNSTYISGVKLSGAFPSSAHARGGIQHVIVSVKI